MLVKIKYYKNYPEDLTILEKTEETTETLAVVLSHLHVIEAEEVKEEVKVKSKGRKKKLEDLDEAQESEVETDVQNEVDPETT